MSTISNAPGIALYTMGTPNGHKIGIYLEELRKEYGLDYMLQKLEITTNIQKEPWFIAINPNGRIPAIVDNSRGGFNIFESAAILLYLAQHYDQQKRFWFDPVLQPDDHSEMLQWIFFVHSGIGPMQGQVRSLTFDWIRLLDTDKGDAFPSSRAGGRVSGIRNVFSRKAELRSRSPYAKKRYLDETRRLYGVLEIRLKNREYLAGPGKGVYSIADMNAFSWVRQYERGLPGGMEEFPSVIAWLARIEPREGVQAGLQRPPTRESNLEHDKAWFRSLLEKK